jgi:hypothetical protein
MSLAVNLHKAVFLLTKTIRRSGNLTRLSDGLKLWMSLGNFCNTKVSNASGIANTILRQIKGTGCQMRANRLLDFATEARQKEPL